MILRALDYSDAGDVSHLLDVMNEQLNEIYGEDIPLEKLDRILALLRIAHRESTAIAAAFARLNDRCEHLEREARKVDRAAGAPADSGSNSEVAA